MTDGTAWFGIRSEPGISSIFLPIRLQLQPISVPTTHVPHPPSLQGFCLLCVSCVDIRMHGVVLLYVLASLYFSLVNLGLI